MGVKLTIKGDVFGDFNVTEAKNILMNVKGQLMISLDLSSMAIGLVLKISQSLLIRLYEEG